MPGHTFRNLLHRIVPLFLLTAFAGLIFASVNVTRVSETLGDLRSRAWSGASVNIQKYRELLLRTPAEPVTTVKEGAADSSRSLFHALSRTYFDAEVQNIADPVSGVKGVAFLAYDAPLDQTVIFARIEKLPLLARAVVQLWVSKDIGAYQKAGVAEFSVENDIPVAYSVFTRKGDLRTYKTLSVSYDTSPTVSAPESIVLTLSF